MTSLGDGLYLNVSSFFWMCAFVMVGVLCAVHKYSYCIEREVFAHMDDDGWKPFETCCNVLYQYKRD